MGLFTRGNKRLLACWTSDNTQKRGDDFSAEPERERTLSHRRPMRRGEARWTAYLTSASPLGPPLAVHLASRTRTPPLPAVERAGGAAFRPCCKRRITGPHTARRRLTPRGEHLPLRCPAARTRFPSQR